MTYIKKLLNVACISAVIMVVLLLVFEVAVWIDPEIEFRNKYSVEHPVISCPLENARACRATFLREHSDYKIGGVIKSTEKKVYYAILKK